MLSFSRLLGYEFASQLLHHIFLFMLYLSIISQLERSPLIAPWFDFRRYIPRTTKI